MPPLFSFPPLVFPPLPPIKISPQPISFFTLHSLPSSLSHFSILVSLYFFFFFTMVRTRDLQLPRADHFHKFLKPGALARIRDSRITARSHRLTSLRQISLRSASPPSSPRSTHGLSQVNIAEAPPCFAGRTYGPRCPQRKRLVAAKYVFVVAAAPSNLAVNSTDLTTDSFNNDVALPN